MAASLFICPVCQETLVREERRYFCNNRHSFDMAKEGYVNLLLANQMRSKNPGDSSEMLQARRRFLNSGYYDLLANALAEKVRDVTGLWQDKCGAVLDIGCGEGFFLSALKKAFQNDQLTVEAYGTDVSKVAMKMAAKADKLIQFAVANSFKLPILSESIDVALRMFAPGDDAEVIRCLKKNGVLVTVTPGPRHLLGLKEKIYQKADLHADEIKVIDGLEFVDSKHLQWGMDVDNQADLHDLLTMTPFYWNGDAKIKAQLQALSALKTDVDFIIAVYKK